MPLVLPILLLIQLDTARVVGITPRVYVTTDSDIRRRCDRDRLALGRSQHRVRELGSGLLLG